MVMLSVIVPVYNELHNIGPLTARLYPVLSAISAESFEILMVDDGSTDGSSELIDELATSDPRLISIHCSRRFGHQAAIQAGLDMAKGDAIIIMDADLQDPPELICTFVERWRQGYDVVYGVRKNRKEGLVKRAFYTVFYRTMKVTANIEVPLDAGDFCLMDKRVVRTVRSLRERNRFLRGLRAWVGFKQVGVEYDRGGRHAGYSKYTPLKLVSLALSGYVGFSILPLRVAIVLGISLAISGILMAVAIGVLRILNVPMPWGWASLSALVLATSGVQLLVLGVMGEYLGRIYDEARARPLYIVRSSSRPAAPFPEDRGEGDEEERFLR
jgi:glycosyltransferase involved in cell wall biosynthesis